MRYGKIKLALIIIVIVAALYSLYPTYQLYFSIPKRENYLKNLLSNAQTKEDSARIQSELVDLEGEKIKIHKRALNLGLDLVGGMHLVLEIDKSQLARGEVKDAADRAQEIIKNRVDQFGVFEPIIQRMGEDRILVQLPGVDRARAKSIIGQTALLEFKLVAEERFTAEVLKKIDEYSKKVAKDTLKEGSFLNYLIDVGKVDLGVDERDLPYVSGLLKEVDTIINFPSRPERDQYEFLFGPLENYEGKRIRRLYLLKKVPELTGKGIASARVDAYQGSNINLANTWIVSLKLNREATRTFASVTGRNVGRRLAIVLDGVVRSAPVIQERIPSGEAMITTGDVNPERARDLAIVIRSGSLPAPVLVIEERSVGPALGLDAINKGIKSVVIAAILVLIFMAFYYKLSGLIADCALFFNILFTLAVLASLRATLTLPGLAALALTVGMGVDANVLIFERIREELRLGRTVRAAVDTGFSRALVTIIDANVTTVITALVLYFFGTGPIKGFSLTLIFGLLINLFTAVFLTKFAIDALLTKVGLRSLPI
ncbi:MAG: protein translocase subunit SecD [candidate division WOR-3 bacterium]